MRLEKEYQRWLLKLFESRGALTLNVHGHAFQRSGWPDLQVYHPLWCGHLELKVKNAGLSQLQVSVCRRLAQCTNVFVIRFFDDCAFLETLHTDPRRSLFLTNYNKNEDVFALFNQMQYRIVVQRPEDKENQ